jgi:hypothetical protein
MDAGVANVRREIGAFLFRGREFLAVGVQSDGFTEQASDGVDKLGQSAGIVGNSLGEIDEVELRQELADAQRGEREGEVVELFDLVLAGEFGGEFEVGTVLFETLLVLEPVLETALVPVGKVVLGEVGDARAEGGEDVLVGETVVHELVEALAEGFGETGDFATATTGRGPKSEDRRPRSEVRGWKAEVRGRWEG